MEPVQPTAIETAKLIVIGTKEVTAPAGLKLRAGPSTDHPEKRIMPLGTVVEVVQEGVWDFIRVDGEEGYASGEWLSALAPAGALGIGGPLDIGEGFDSPVGTPDQRRGVLVWPEQWLDANPYLTFYTFGQPERTAFHTGADLNLPGDADRDKPVHACAAGFVVYAQLVPDSSWGNLVVIRHTMPDGSTVHSRYGHLKKIEVAKGERVARGRQIGTVGGADFGLANHLHFDVSPSGILESNPTHWPGNNQQLVQDHYVDPCEFVRSHRPAAAPVHPVASLIEPVAAEAIPAKRIGTKQVVADAGLFLRERPDTASDSKLLMDKGTLVEVLEEGVWDRVRLGDVVGYASSEWLSPLMPVG